MKNILIINKFSYVGFLLLIFGCSKEIEVKNSLDIRNDKIELRTAGCQVLDLVLTPYQVLDPNTRACRNVKVTLNTIDPGTPPCAVKSAQFTFYGIQKDIDGKVNELYSILGIHSYSFQTSPNVIGNNYTFMGTNSLNSVLQSLNNVTPNIIGDGDNFVIESSNSLGFPTNQVTDEMFIKVCVKYTSTCPLCSETTICKEIQIFCS